MGRPTKLTPSVHQAIVEVIRKGNYLSTACAIAGIQYNAYYDWLQRGTKDTEEGLVSVYSEFTQDIKKAEAEAEAELVEVVRNAGTIKKEWLPAITMLERRHPDRYGRKDRSKVEITESKNITITHVEVRMPDTIEGEFREIKELKGETDVTIKEEE